MPLITDGKLVLDIYHETEQKKWTLPCFCTENLTTTEAILEATFYNLISPEDYI